VLDATVHTVAGETIEHGYVHFSRGKIVAVGRDASALALPKDAERLDAGKKHVYPGLIGACTQLGLIEIGQVRATVDQRELGPVTPEVVAAVAVNPDSAVIPVTRANGILAAGVFPLGDLVAGHASVIQLEGWTAEDMTVRADAGLALSWPGMRVLPRRFADRLSARAPAPEDAEKQKRQRLAELEELFLAAKGYLAARASDPRVAVDVRLEGLRSVLERKCPVFVRAEELEQIQSAVAFGKRHGLEVVIVGGRDAELCLDLLEREKIAVVLLGTHTLPRHAESAYDEPFKLPVLLEEAGLRWCLASGEEHAHERNLPHHAATAVAFGLSHAAALRAVTLSAAKILGVADRLGSLEAGKDATLFVCNGDPLEITTRVEIAFVQGRRVDLSSKQTKLAEKYGAGRR
jgi:imidazolonepropionase-like amidohydrolase